VSEEASRKRAKKWVGAVPKRGIKGTIAEKRKIRKRGAVVNGAPAQKPLKGDILAEVSARKG